jgi:hypothetical protein
MNPPPPILPASGNVTVSANPTATAASTAFPPFSSIARPTDDACGQAVTTMPARARARDTCSSAADSLAWKREGNTLQTTTLAARITTLAVWRLVYAAGAIMRFISDKIEVKLCAHNLSAHRRFVNNELTNDAIRTYRDLIRPSVGFSTGICAEYETTQFPPKNIDRQNTII